MVMKCLFSSELCSLRLPLPFRCGVVVDVVVCVLIVVAVVVVNVMIDVVVVVVVAAVIVVVLVVVAVVVVVAAAGVALAAVVDVVVVIAAPGRHHCYCCAGEVVLVFIDAASVLCVLGCVGVMLMVVACCMRMRLLRCILLAIVAASRGCYFILEQPMSSLMNKHPRFQEMCVMLKAGLIDSKTPPNNQRTPQDSCQL